MTDEEKVEKEKLAELRNELRNEALNQMGEAIQTEMDLIQSNNDPNGYVKSIAAQLRLHGVKNMRIDFAGGGDSGQIESISVTDNDDEISSQWGFEHQRNSFFKVISNWAYKFIETNSQTDWYNDDGGNGHIEFDLENNRFDWEVYYYVSESHLGDSGEENL